MTSHARLDAQMDFLAEACKLKLVTRQSALQDLSRQENSAEHSWHVALFALVMDLPELADPADRMKAIQMLLLHDLVEIDAGDHPIDEAHDAEEIAQKEQQAADRLFGLLPPDQARHFRALWDEFERGESAAAIGAKRMDHVQPMLQAAAPATPLPLHIEVVENNLTSGRARNLQRDWPEMFAQVRALLDGKPRPEEALARRIDFLNEADKLKSVTRATKVIGGLRRENSAEHSWHLALYAMVLAEHAPQPVQLSRVIAMLLLHDLVEIDAGDTPIFGVQNVAETAAEEEAAATRLFGVLPTEQGAALMTLWQEFESNESPDARFAKSLDRFQPPNLNLASAGGSWVEYGVTFEVMSEKVGRKIAHGAPVLWQWLSPRVKSFFDAL